MAGGKCESLLAKNVGARALCLRAEDTCTLFPVLYGLWNVYLLRCELARCKDLATQNPDVFRDLADSETRREILEFADIFRGTVVDVSKRSVTIEITGGDSKIQAFERMIRPFGLIEMVRTGEIAVSRGRSAT